MGLKKRLLFFMLSWAFCVLLTAQAGSDPAARRLICEPQFPVVGQRVTFIATNFRTPHLLRWDMGDGTVMASGSTSPQAKEVRMSYAYFNAGVYEVKVYDDNGDLNSPPLAVIVWVKADGPPPTVGAPEKTVAVPEKNAPVPVQPAPAQAVETEPIAPAKDRTAAAKKYALFKFGPVAGVFLPQNGLVRDVYGSFDLVYGGRVGVRIWRGIYVWLSGAQVQSSGKTTLLEEPTSLTLVPFSAFLRLGLRLGSVMPYAGIGYTYLTFKEESDIGDTSGNGSSFSLEAGFELRLNRIFALDLGARFDQILVQPGDLEEEIDVGGLQIGLGLLISF
jgi:hypothetical protein